MACVGNMIDICKSHMRWELDSLVIYYAHEKTDQTQSRTDIPRHIYANPYQPDVCPILALGIYFLLVDVTNTNDPHIFIGSRQATGFDKCIKERIVESLEEEQEQLLREEEERLEREEREQQQQQQQQQQQVDNHHHHGQCENQQQVQRRMLILDKAAAASCTSSSSSSSSAAAAAVMTRINGGTHSIRKGSSTYGSSCSNSCSTFASICQRAGWSLYHTQGEYLRYEKSGDQYVGRTLSGFEGHDDSFTVLPPDFKKEHEDIVIQILHDHFVNYDRIGYQFQRVLRMCMASVIFHIDKIKNEYNCCHTILQKPLFRKNYGVPLNELVEIKEWESGGVMRPTGIPTEINLMKEVKKNEKEEKDIEERRKKRKIKEKEKEKEKKRKRKDIIIMMMMMI